MTFTFQIEDVFEIYRDPMGHYHHWTILAGKLTSGRVRKGDKILIPGTDGIDNVAYVLGFETRHRDHRLEVTAGQIGETETLGLGTWKLAPLKHKVRLGTATQCSDETYHDTLMRILKEDPERIFHSRGPGYLDRRCRECDRVIENYPEAIPILQALAEQKGLPIAAHANYVLNKMMAPDARSPITTKPKRWAFGARMVSLSFNKTSFF